MWLVPVDPLTCFVLVPEHARRPVRNSTPSMSSPVTWNAPTIWARSTASVRHGDDQLAAHVALATALESSGQLVELQNIGYRHVQLPGVGQSTELG